MDGLVVFVFVVRLRVEFFFFSLPSLACFFVWAPTRLRLYRSSLLLLCAYAKNGEASAPNPS